LLARSSRGNKKLHLALGVKDIQETVRDYENRLCTEPTVVVHNEYALFRTETLNVSIRKVEDKDLGLRHLGWESDDYTSFSEEKDCNGITWEAFNWDSQKQEIKDIWPEADLK
jgi:extradiol dioxygenase family protein